MNAVDVVDEEGGDVEVHSTQALPQHHDPYTQVLLESYHLAQRRLFAHDLAEERDLRERAEVSEGELRRVIAFKDNLIQEVNHRAKNTLQVAASLLTMHLRATTSPEVRAALEGSRTQLGLLARTHELLSSSPENTQEILMPLMLEAIADALRQSFAEVSSRVTLHVTCDQILVAGDVAIALTLLANELVTNAYKHAFPAPTGGTIALSLTCAEGNAITLRVMDNGCGTPSDRNSSGMGLRLLNGLAKQLRATLVFDQPPGSNGTVATVRMRPARV